MNWDGKFWKGVFSEADGTPSFTRVASGMLLAFACGWVSCLVYRNNALPDLGGLALLIGTPYGLNKLSQAAAQKLGAAASRAEEK
jgi:hypothetical protein